MVRKPSTGGITAKSANQIVLPIPRWKYKNAVLYSPDPPFLLKGWSGVCVWDYFSLFWRSFKTMWGFATSLLTVSTWLLIAKTTVLHFRSKRIEKPSKKCSGQNCRCHNNDYILRCNSVLICVSLLHHSNLQSKILAYMYCLYVVCGWCVKLQSYVRGRGSSHMARCTTWN